MKTILIILTILLLPFFGMSQSIDKFSLDGGGLSANAGGIHILYTIGEVNVQEIRKGNIIVSEGFINPSHLYISNTILEEDPHLNRNEALEINEQALKMISVYPNPTENVIYIESPNTFMTTATIYDATGRKIVEKEANKSSYLQMDLSELNNAIYYLEINTEAGKISKQVIKE